MSQGIDTFGCISSTIKVASGHYLNLVDPKPSDIDIESIASALSKICRFGGHCPRFYSVAEHCIHAQTLAYLAGHDREPRLAVLLHDAAEAYIGDMVKPLKNLIPEYSVFETKIEAAIGARFGIDFDEHADKIKQYDRSMLKTEKMTMWPNDSVSWAGFSEIDAAPITLQYWGPKTAKENFLFIAKGQLGIA